MTNEERVMRLFEKKEVDFLPSQISFSDVTRHEEIAKTLGLSGPEAIDSYLQNHIAFTFVSDDIPLFYRNDLALMDELEAKGFCKVDRENNIVYDNWGIGILVGEDGFFCCYSPLAGNKEQNEKARKFLPERLQEVIDMPLKEAVKAYTAPDPLAPHNLDWLERDVAMRGDFMVIPSGYFSLYERSYAILGFENFMTEIAGDVDIVHSIIQKVTDYRVALAKPKHDLGYMVNHYGDDLGMQCSGFFSKKMFDEVLYPYYKIMFAAHKKYNHYMITHSCGVITDYLPQLIDIGLNGWEPVQPCNDLEMIKREFGKDLVLWGGIDTQQLPFLTPSEVKRLSKQVIYTLGKGGGHIIAPAQEIMNDVPLENVVALLETIVEEREKVLKG